MSKASRPHKPERDLAIHQILRAIRGIPSKDIAAKTFVSAATIDRWRSSQTRYPQHCTLAAVARAAGFEWKLVEVNESVRPRKANKADAATESQAVL
jgi:transcriptional regulator with XRE-family HTH domain